METTFSSLLEHIETFPVNAEVNKKEEELYCATAFITLLQSGLLTQDVDESGAPDKPCGVGRADANPKLLLNDT